MRYLLLLAFVFVLGIFVYLQWGTIDRVLNISGSSKNPTNINTRLQENQKDLDQYDQYIDDLQKQTDDALNSGL